MTNGLCKNSPVAIAILVCVCLMVVPASAQESQRDLKDAKKATKYLSHGVTDSWLFEGKKNETVIVFVSTTEFDPVIGLAKVGENSEELLFEVDDEGSQSRFSYRLKQDGNYKIRVHAFEMKGGGNYSMDVLRFVGKPIEIAQKVTGKFDSNGQANFFFQGRRDNNLLVVQTGSKSEGVYDPKGNGMAYNWHTNILVQNDGEHLISLNGRRGHNFSLLLRPDVRTSLQLDDIQTVETADRALNIWEIDAEPGQFRYITVTRNFDVDPRLIYAPREIKRQKLLDQERKYKEIAWLPVSNKGDLTQYAVVFGRRGRFQLQVFSHAKSSVTVSMHDPTITIEPGELTTNQIPIGGTQFYGFAAKAGDLLEAKLDSVQFDCFLRLYDERGQLVRQNDDGFDTKNSLITHMVTRNAFYRWHVSSLGNGGGGAYELAFNEIELKPLQIGQTNSGHLKSGTTEYWSLDGEKGKSIFVNVRSSELNPIVQIYSPDGNRLGQDDEHGVALNSLLAVKLAKSGRYTVWVSSHRDGGNYDIRVIDADWNVDQ